ncbi:6-phospho-3-hexuloisomerase [Candidatus Micrarchaeota archaeon]|nr:6-phospho-3-hexuloisomerase [Candidatus Micrarchaeota archaeon]
MKFSKKMELLAQALVVNTWAVEDKQVEGLLKLILKAKRVFIIGAGRSGYVGRAFAMRLMHLDFNVYVVGEPTTPAIGKGDLLIAITGSGETESVAHVAKAAKKQGAQVGVVTSHLNSTIGKLADAPVKVGGRVAPQIEQDYFVRQIKGGYEPLAPLGTLFELSSMVFLDTIINELMGRRGKTESELKMKHSNLE